MEYQNRQYSNATLYKFSYSDGKSKTTEPKSWVLYGNPEYKLFFCNCMQRSVQILLFGKLYNNHSTFIKRLCQTFRYVTPNHALDVMRYGVGIFDNKSIGSWSEF